MRIVVSDSSCLIDLRKVSLLAAFLKLPYEVLIPNILFDDELLKFTATEKRALLRGGLNVVEVPGTGVLRARQIIQTTPRLSINDGFAFAVAESRAGCILVTGDGLLRTVATEHGIEVHGVLWIIDELHRHEIETPVTLAEALRLFGKDQTVRLPRRELFNAIRRYEGLS
jgi:predicted nucleic acid-binding protein